MLIKILFITILNVVSFSIGCKDKNIEKEEIIDNGTVNCVQVDVLEKIFKKQTNYAEVNVPVAVAKGETASFQLVVNSTYAIKVLSAEVGDLVNGNHRIPSGQMSLVGYVRISPDQNIGNGAAPDRIIPSDGYYPDPLPESSYTNVDAESNQPIWISYSIPRDAAEGVYTADVFITGIANGAKFRLKRQLSAKVYPVVLPEQTLLVEHWFTGWTELKYMNYNNPVTPFSSLGYQLYGVVTRKAAEYGTNVFRVLLTSNIQPTLQGNTYTFDFSRFDKMVELYLQEGNPKRIVGGFLGARFSEAGAGWTGPFGVYVPTGVMGADGIPLYDILPQNDPKTLTWLNQFLPAFYQHLVSKGWDRIYIQHLADEPLPENAASYNAFADLVKSIVPELKIVDAIMTTNTAASMDIPCPLLSTLHTDYTSYQQLQASGKEIWYYVCDSPKWNYANRFIELPLIKTRIQHWINYRYNVTGFLHWAFHNWRSGYTVGDNVVWVTVPGDSWLAYPEYGKTYSSIRLEAMRDGINDYELLRLLEKKNHEGAKELAEGVVVDFDSYDTDIVRFRERRIKMLQWLSE
ncbi:MAG: DUF4091 domain-containing protein [Dysgonamonadaceae bacterium]|nr:DUF4091 domain-containing protein [Dysgonamonadaceae bacterium]